MKVAYNRFWREKFNEEEAKSGKPRGTSCSIRLLKCRRPVAVLVNIALNSSYLSAGKNCSEILGQDSTKRQDARAASVRDVQHQHRPFGKPQNIREHWIRGREMGHQRHLDDAVGEVCV